MPTWGRDGSTRLLAIDLDASRGDVAADADVISATLTGCGARVVRDVSPSGGQHVYVILAEPVGIAEMAPLARGLEARHPSVDIAPMVNVAAGYIRPPGSRHRSGGWQQLLQPLTETIAALSSPAPLEVWRRIQAAYPAPPVPAVTVDPDLGAPDALAPLPGYRGQISGKYVQIATRGDWTSHGYRSPSEGRQAVVWAAAAAGLSLATVASRIHTGAWPGLASLYHRYGRHTHKALAADWHRATRFEQQRREGTRSTVHPRNTRRPSHSPSTPGSASESLTHPYGRDWTTAVELVKSRWGDDAATHLVLRALGQVAQQTGSTIIDRGVRGLALATQLDPSTVSRVLTALRAEEDPVIERLEKGRGVRADQYRLVIPTSVATSVARTPWRPGQVRGLHPFARELGRVAGWVWELLRGSGDPLSVRDLVERSPYSRQAVHEALRTLASFDLAAHSENSDTWERGGANPAVIAMRVGADVVHQELVQLYRAQRLAWIDYLTRCGRDIVLPAHAPPPVAGAALSPPPDPFEAAAALLAAVLGAVPCGSSDAPAMVRAPRPGAVIPTEYPASPCADSPPCGEDSSHPAPVRRRFSS